MLAVELHIAPQHLEDSDPDILEAMLNYLSDKEDAARLEQHRANVREMGNRI